MYSAYEKIEDAVLFLLCFVMANQIQWEGSKQVVQVELVARVAEIDEGGDWRRQMTVYEKPSPALKRPAAPAGRAWLTTSEHAASHRKTSGNKYITCHASY